VRQWIACVLTGLAVATVLAGPAVADDPKPAESAVPSKSAAAAAEPEEIRLPPGFKPRKRGKFTLYCKTDTAIGTRFKSETCLDADQIRDYLIAMQENKSDIDRIRATCSNLCTCGQPEAC
jgi:hypothetical protein